MKITYSIIIPFYHGEKFYPKLLFSILKAVQNCNINNLFFEIITIVDSIESNLFEINDVSHTMFQSQQNVELVNLKNNVNLGVASTRNKGIKISKGEFLHLIDQDDEVSPNIYHLSKLFLGNFNFLLFNGRMVYSSGKFNTHKIYYLKPDLTIKGLIEDDYIRSPGQIIFSKVLIHQKLFPETQNFKGADDRFFWLRLFFENKDTIKPKYIANECYIANIHESNYSNDRDNLDKSCLENWKNFVNEVDTISYDNLISRDIIRVNYKLNQYDSLNGLLKGFFLQFFFNLKMSKLIRFVIKRFSLK